MGVSLHPHTFSEGAEGVSSKFYGNDLCPAGLGSTLRPHQYAAGVERFFSTLHRQLKLNLLTHSRAWSPGNLISSASQLSFTHRLSLSLPDQRRSLVTAARTGHCLADLLPTLITLPGSSGSRYQEAAGTGGSGSSSGLWYTDTGTGIGYDTYRIHRYTFFQKTLIRGYG